MGSVFVWAGLAAAGLAGFGGAALIARYTSGLRLMALMALWLVAPFVALAVALSSASDPTLSPERASYNFWFGLVLISILIAVPWAVAMGIGFAVGRKRRGLPKPAVPSPPAKPVAQPFARTQSALPDGRPDWREADYPKVPIELLADRIREIALRNDFEEHRLPGLYTGRDGGEGTFIDQDKFDYVYAYRERGTIRWQKPEVIADKLLYHVFSDLAFERAMKRLAGRGIADTAMAAEVEREQQAILAGIDPRWGLQFAADSTSGSVGTAASKSHG